jgi:DNA-binding NarL/FixJ family response regulator
MAHRILLIDDHEIVRQGLKALIDSHDDLEVVGEGSSVEDAIKRTGFDSPDMVLLDVRLTDGSGVEACREIRQRFPDVRVLMLTSFADEDALIAAIMAGASGYVLKRIRGDELIDSIRRVCAGESLLDPDMVGRLFDRLRTGGSTDPLLEKLSDQERKILGFIAEGMTNRQIAAEMFLAEKTVKNYVSNMLTKMGMSRRTEAAAYMARLDAERDEPPETWADGSLEPH